MVNKNLGDQLAEARRIVRDLLLRDQRNTCTHDETYRGGSIWEICQECGAMWADDRGGKPEWKDPPEWDAAYAFLAATAARDELEKADK